MYRSSNWSWMNRRMRQVFPTAPSPTRQIFTFIFWRSICILWLGLTRHNPQVIKALPNGYLLDNRRGRRREICSRSRLAAVPDCIRERSERLSHSVAVFRRRQEVRRVVDRAHPREFFLADDESLAQVHLVSKEDDGDGPDLLADHLDPA